MDSITQAVLGAGVAGLWAKKLGKKVLPWGMAIATVPDLDVFVGPLLYGQGLDAMFFHRGPMHSILFCVLLAPILASFFRYVLYQKKDTWWSWFWLSLFALVTHPLLDSLTNYGTSLWWPFLDTKVSLNSIFIVDPLYTLPFLILVLFALFVKKRNTIRKLSVRGLGISSAYLVLGLGLKTWLHPHIHDGYQTAGFDCESIMTTPEAFQIFLWKAVGRCDGQVVESWYHVFDLGDPLQIRIDSAENGLSVIDSFVVWEQQSSLLDSSIDTESVGRVVKRSEGYYIVDETLDNKLLLYDMRFGRLAGWAFARPPSFFAYSVDRMGISSDDTRYEGGFPDGVRSELWNIILYK